MPREDPAAGYKLAVLAAAVRRQRSHAEGSQGFAGQERRTGKGSTGSLNARGTREFGATVNRKKTYVISKAYAARANSLRGIQAGPSRGALLPSRSHRITFPGS